MASLEERIQRLEEIEAIRRLKQTYARIADRRGSGAEIAALFTEDGISDDGDFGKTQGRAAIAAFFDAVKPKLPFFLHYMLGDIIDIEPSGTDATGTWYQWEPATLNGEAVWMGITFNDRYKKVNGQWQFASFGSKIHFITPYDKGWVKQPFPMA